MKQQIVLAFKFLTLAGVYLFTRARTPNYRRRNPDKSMVVVFVLEYVKRILVYNACLIRDAKNEVEILENDIRLFKAFLKECARIRRKEEAVEEFISEIQGVVRQGDDLIVGYWNIAAEIRDRNFLQRNFGSQMKLISVAKEVKAMKVKVKNIYSKSKAVFGARRK